jgi:hypothetical protein
MFGFFKSKLKKALLEQFNADFEILLNHMIAETQLEVYRSLRADLEYFENVAGSGSSSTMQIIQQIAISSKDKRNMASNTWHDKRNPEWMAASLIETVCNAALANDEDVFSSIYDPLKGWASTMEMIDL